jgi:hypothetical protein
MIMGQIKSARSFGIRWSQSWFLAILHRDNRTWTGAMTVLVAEDRSMCVQPDQVVRTAWVDIDLCKLVGRVRMSPEAVEKKFRRLLNLGEAAPWPPVVGHWQGERFLVDDGRHDYLAALMLGREKLFVCWLDYASTEPIRQNGGLLETSAAPPGSAAESRYTMAT